MQQVPYRVPPYFFVAGRCLPLAGLFLALMLAAAQVAAQQTTLVTITAVGTVGSSGLVEVDEGDDVVFELTRTGDLTSPLTVTVAIDEAGDGNQVAMTPFSRDVVFPAGQSTVQLRENTNADDEFEEDTEVSAGVAPAAVAEGESGYYAAGSPGLASVLVLDDDIPEMRAYAETTQVRINENGGKYKWRAIVEADERPHNRILAIRLFVANYLLEKESVSAASADDVSFLLPGGFDDDELPASPPEDSPKDIHGPSFSRVSGRLQWRLFIQGGHEFIVKDDDQMEGDETLLVDFYQDNDSDPRISLINSLPGRLDVDGDEVFPDTIITIVDNDFVTIAANNPEVNEGEEIVFELTRPGDTASELTVTVAIDEPQDANRVLEETAPFTKEAVFLANEPTTRLTVPTVDDAIAEAEAMVTAMVVFSPDYSASPGDDEYYNAAPTPASLLVRDNDTALVTITAVGAVGDSGLVEMDEGGIIVFRLTRTGDSTSELPVTVLVEGAGGGNQVTITPCRFRRRSCFRRATQCGN